MATPSAEQINEVLRGFDRLYGLELVEFSDEEVRARVEVREELKQPVGLVHGGVYASIAESLTSLATAMAVLPKLGGDGPVEQHELPAPGHRGHGACARHAPAPGPHHVGVGRALQRRRRQAVRGHAHDDRRAPAAAQTPPSSSREEPAPRAATPRPARSPGCWEGSGRSPKPVSGSGGASGAPGCSSALIVTIVFGGGVREPAAVGVDVDHHAAGGELDVPCRPEPRRPRTPRMRTARCGASRRAGSCCRER